ncbi:Hexaprenyldihydroxybenzoate methyltransferase, mitochondrial [Spiromyces aspiralis]|uniref:Hexaprenyldihydroxybenzoate methyltransferase, mitochondrial n=1 Tax=Spiromyces aspiralis TaxID=68401 RepID=A0ACC1HH54_9FUNG|nr:Hexaprenyldihydroxybenzoate methyltransferase, mitochondrial [Spiromyces aspiralis]
MTVTFNQLDDGMFNGMFNDITYRAPKVPTLYTVKSLGQDALNQEVYGRMTNTYVFDNNETVQVVLLNGDGDPHPFHLHGNTFQVVARGDDINEFSVDKIPNNPNPMRRDTVVLPAEGYVVLRFLADNPGAWLFHCHNEWHMISGLSSVFVVDPISIQNNQSISSEMQSFCPYSNFKTEGNAAGNKGLSMTGDLDGPHVIDYSIHGSGIGALAACVISAVLGFLAVIWYSLSDPALDPKPDSTAARCYSARSSVSPDEVTKFSALSAEWWDPSGPFKPLHQMNPTRVEYIAEWSRLLKRPISDTKRLFGLSVLDVGCGGGMLDESLARLGAAVTGIDASEKNIAIAKAHAKKDPVLSSDKSSLTYVCTTAEELTKNRQVFDLVISSEVIEHVVDPQQFIATLVSLTKPGGLLCMTTINKTLLAGLLDIVLPEYILGIVPRGTHNYDRFVRPDQVRKALRMAGCHLLDISGLWYLPFFGTWKVVRPDIGGIPNAGIQANYIFCAQRPK